MTVTQVSVDWEHSKCLSALHISLFTPKHHTIRLVLITLVFLLLHEETNTLRDCHLSFVQGQSGSSRIGFVRDLADLILKSLCSHTYYIMLLPTLPNGNVNRHSWTNKSKWVTSEDVALGRFCSQSSDAAIIQNTATAKRNNLRALYLQLKIPSEPPPMTWNIFNGDKSLSFVHQFDFLTTQNQEKSIQKHLASDQQGYFF